ncbi:MAG TPA: hypothetical protein EYG70_03830 [Sulfurimonas sp.]|nr:hypothetical protein [Sulfurimonas sp.]
MTEDLLKSISKEKNVHSIIVLTHNIDFIFIQTVVLKFLKKMGSPSLTIFADAQCVQESYENQKMIIHGLGKRYRVVPVSLDRSYDRFHPKAVLLSSHEKASLYIGSGNLTFGGWRQNAEIWNRYTTKEDGTAVFNAFKDYLDGMIKRLPYTSNISNTINNAYNKETAPWSINMESSAGLIGRINTKSSLLEQMKEYVEVGCEKLIIQSPYFDKEGKTIQQLNELFEPKAIEIFAQNRHSELTEEIIGTLEDNISITPTNFTHYANDKPKRAFIHAKYYAFLYHDKAIVFSGSANCSQAALSTSSIKVGNAELVSVKEMSLADFNRQYNDDIEKVTEFIAKKQSEVEESYDEIITHKPVQIHSAQFEYKHIKVAVTLHEDYQIIASKIDDIIYNVTHIKDNLLHIEGFDNEPNILCLLLKNKRTDKEVYSDEIWIDDERKLSTSSKTRSLSDFIQSSSELSWNHNAFGDLLKVFNEHLAHTPKRDDAHALGNTKTHDKARTVFNPSDVFVDNYNFTSLHSNNSNRYAFDIHAILRQYLGLYNQHIDDDGKEELTQEELQEQLDKDTVNIDPKTINDANPKTMIDEQGRKKIKKLIETLVAAFTNEEIVTNRPLVLLLDDLKVASIILRMGLSNEWVTKEEYFDTSYTLWTEFFFSCSLDENRGYIDLKLDQEDIDIEELYSAELSASMLTWLFAIEPSNEIQYIRLLMSAILVQAKYNWIFFGSDYEQINIEINKALVAFNPKDLDKKLSEHAVLWNLIRNTGNAFAELISKVTHHKISDYKDRLPMKEIEKGELLWQGTENFYIVNSRYKRQPNRQSKFKADVVPLSRLKKETSFISDFTIPLHDLFDLEEFQNLTSKQHILNFIDDYLMNIMNDK